MNDNQEQECKSGLHHEWNVEDRVLHYFGCMEFKERDAFFKALPEDDKLKRAIVDEETRIQKLRATFQKDGPKTEYGKLLSSFKIALSLRFPAPGQRPPPQHPPPSTATSPVSPQIQSSNPEDPLRGLVDLEDLKANVMYYKNNRPFDHPSFEGTFPNQKIPLATLLMKDEKKNPLMWECEEDMIRYFHVPANNMEWIEACFYLHS